MRTHTAGYKEAIKTLGRELDVIITYGTETIGTEDLFSVTPIVEGNILKSVMKQLNVETSVNLPVDTEINCKFGIKVNGTYEYIDFGNYIVYTNEYNADNESYTLTCYDKMLSAMKDYEELDITYPITIRDYINKISTHLGLEFANLETEFINYSNSIPSELYKDLGYTFRDILDELAQATASTICINKDDKLEIRYITDTNDTINEEYLKDINVSFGEKYGPVNSIVLSRSAESDNITKRDEESIEENGLTEVKIVDNQIMNDNNRSDYLEGIFNQLSGLEYYINDFSSTGITYLEVCDKYNVSINGTTYGSVLFNDEIDITQGIEEQIHTDQPEESETDYSKTDSTDKKIKQAYIIVDKQLETITERVGDLEEVVDTGGKPITDFVGTQIEQKKDSIVNSVKSKIDEDGVTYLKNTLVTIDKNGLNVSTNTSQIKTQMTNDTFSIKSGDTNLAYFGYDTEEGITKAEMDNLTVDNFLTTGYHRIQKYTNQDGEERTGFFWIGD